MPTRPSPRKPSAAGREHIAEQMDEVDPDAILAVRTALRRHLARELEADFAAAYARFETAGPYSPDPVSAGKRSLRNLALGYLVELETDAIRTRALDQLTTADNMTDAMAALVALANCDCPERPRALDAFYAKWQDEPLVVDKWFSVQASSRLPGTLIEVRRLLEHPAFDRRNPNKVRPSSAPSATATTRFHAAGAGYASPPSR